MYQAVDSTEIDQAPLRNANEYAAIYFVVFIFIGSFFFLNLFIGVIFETFNEAHKNSTPITAFFLSNKKKL